MLDITGKDICELSDKDLRSLIGLLCEAELRSRGLPTDGVTWGGHQNAADGGLDVRVELNQTIQSNGFIPRALTGYQVKCQDMPRSEILKEMKTKGKLRPVIKDFLKKHGAYIIVSSQGSTADKPLTNRKKAMKEALSDLPNASNIKLDFYDRSRIATWVRNHPSLILWVREKIGNPIYGWHPYGNWADSPGGIKEEYLLDDTLRIHGYGLKTTGLSAIDGINHIRNLLRRSGTSIRLIGLSGVGKTRLLQALFDNRIGQSALNQSHVFYSDIGDEPKPIPLHFAEQLLALDTHCILAIDNCPPELHCQLTNICSKSESKIKLITLEYDIRENQPEKTEVISLKPSSNNIIEKIIQKRFKYINNIDTHAVAEFSGGNARIAIALANTFKKGENLSSLSDEYLFERLFYQRNTQSESLLKSAEVCSLVYSFNCQTDVGLDSELKILASLSNNTIGDLYSDVAKLKRRGLVQQRSIWRAVLPQAIANRLAHRALENIPQNILLEEFHKDNSGRLLKSFSRRLSYLHECEAAQKIVTLWLSETGMLKDISNLNDIGISILVNITPIKPEKVLSAIERAAVKSETDFVSRNNNNFIEITHLLRSLAYDKDLFERSANLLCKFALTEDINENHNSIRNMVRTLFFIYLSGTHATAEQRLNVIRKLIDSGVEDRKHLAISLLSSTLNTNQFISHYGFTFGARSRDDGFHPTTSEEIENWFAVFIDYTTQLACSTDSIASKAKDLLAKKFNGLWTTASMFDQLENAVYKISQKGSWIEGWLEIKKTIRIKQDIDLDILSRLNKLECFVKPQSLIDRARLFVITKHWNSLDFLDKTHDENGKEIDSYLFVYEATRSIGKEVANDEKIFILLLPELFSYEYHRMFYFGQGLADECIDPQNMWKTMRNELSKLELLEANVQILRGFLNSLYSRRSSLVDKLLDSVINDPILACYLPTLQTSIEIDVSGYKRLIKSLNLGSAPIEQYKNIGYGRSHENICDKDFANLLMIVSAKSNGIPVALDMMTMRLHGHKKPLNNRLTSLGQELVLKVNFSEIKRNDMQNYEIISIIESCFESTSAKKKAKSLCHHVVKAYANNNIFYSDLDEVLISIARVQPIVIIEVFLEDDTIYHQFTKDFSSYNDSITKPINMIDDDLLINWCDDNPQDRFTKLATVIMPFRSNEKKTKLEWKPIAITMFENSPDPVLVLNAFKTKFTPMSWYGSRKGVMKTRLILLTDLKDHENPLISEWACNEEKLFQQEIESIHEFEMEREDNRLTSFE
ncbi:MAG: hypothetical protein KAU01_01765 [Candidatus Cloacimonetes bacterium]|nr:hypothetical protein [Candidatus Cloacimonadota bacterium]